MTRTSRIRLTTGIGLGVLALGVPIAAMAGPAAASSPGPATMTAVAPASPVASLPGAVKLGAADASAPETVSFVLRERNLGALKAAVELGVHHYLSVGQFARTFGASKDSISALQKYLASFGISTQVYADNIDVVASGTVAQFNQALGVNQAEFRVPQQAAHNGLAAAKAQTVHAATKPAMLPTGIARDVVAVLGLTNYTPFDSQAVHVSDTAAKPKAAASASDCVALTGLPAACHLPSDFASNYKLDGLYNKGAIGSGQTIAIVTLAALDEGSPEYYWKNIAKIPDTGRTVNVVNVDGGPGAPNANAGTGETDLDVEQSGGLAPGANVIVYQAPNTDFGFADAFFQAASDNTASTVSASWLESETYLQAFINAGQEAPNYEAAFDEAFLEMAMQGQSGFIASGDWGAYTASADIGATNLSVGASADSPFITAAGGTTLPWSGTLHGAAGTANVNVSSERAWGWDYLWQPISTARGLPLESVVKGRVTGTGGGFSSIEPRPLYQLGVSGTNRYHAVEYLTPTTPQTIAPGLVEPTDWTFNGLSPSVTSGTASGRAMPDLSADADPYSGYLLYAASNGAGNELQGGWGGTSFVAPQLNGATAVIDSFVGHRVGFWNPAIYAMARGWHSPFTVLNSTGTDNTNIYYTGNPGSLFNPATGLGYPDLTKMAVDFGRLSGSARR